MTFNNRAYDVLKWIALIVLPAVSFFVTTLGDIWEWDNAGKVAATVLAFSFLLGTSLQISNSKHKKEEVFGGYLESPGRDDDTGIPDMKLTVTTDPNKLVAAKYVKLKVGQAPPPPKVADVVEE